MNATWSLDGLRAIFADYMNMCLAKFFLEHLGSDILSRPQSAKEFAANFQYHPNASERFLGAMVHLGLVERSDDYYRRTDREVKVNSNHSAFFESFSSFQACRNASIASWIKTGDDSDLKDFYQFAKQFGAENFWLVQYYVLTVNQYLQAEAIDNCLRTNKPQTGIAMNISSEQIFDYYEKRPHILEAYAEGFSATNRNNNRVLAAQLSVQPGDRLIDVGGGNGSFATVVSQIHPGMSEIVVYDLAESMQDLRASRERWTRLARVKVSTVAGSFFKSGDHLNGLDPNQKFEWIALGWILHDWNDGDCIAILKRARRHLKPGGKILLLEKVMDPAKSNRAAVLDFVMLLMANGFERTLDGYDQLVSAAGLKITNTYFSATGRDLIVVEDPNE